MSADALTQLAAALGMVRLTSVKATYRIDRLAGGGYRLKGRVAADGEQACVISLDPVPAHVDEPFDAEYWPDLPAADGGEDKTILGGRDVERLDGGMIAAGRILFETISAGLDPYPRKPGAEFDWQEKSEPTAANISPFAALAKLKSKP